MATTENPGSVQDPTKMTQDEILSQVSSGLNNSDEMAAQGVATMTLVHQARVAHMTRTAALLSKKFGADDPRTKAAKAAVAAQEMTVARVSMAQQQVSTPAPQVPSTGWTLYGRVFTASMQPATAYTVFLVDAKKAYQQGYGFSYSDKTGYFQLDFAGEKAATPERGESATGATTGAAGRSTSGPQLFIEVANANAQPVYLSTSAFQPVIGAATYKNIVLPAGEKPIGDPPPEIRAVALPKKKKSQ
jgi:hypothetical protein